MDEEVKYCVTPEELHELDEQNCIEDMIGKVALDDGDPMFKKFQECGIVFIEYDRVERFKELICDKINVFFDDYDFNVADARYRKALASLEYDINYCIFVELYKLMIECKCKIESLRKGIEVWDSDGKDATGENDTIRTRDMIALGDCALPISYNDKYVHPYGDALSHSEIIAVTGGVDWIPTPSSIFYDEAMALKSESDFKLTNAGFSYLSSLRPSFKDKDVVDNMPHCTGVINAIDFGLPRYLNYLKSLETLFFEKRKYFERPQGDDPTEGFKILIGAIVKKRAHAGSNRRRRHR